MASSSAAFHRLEAPAASNILHMKFKQKKCPRAAINSVSLLFSYSWETCPALNDVNCRRMGLEATGSPVLAACPTLVILEALDWPVPPTALLAFGRLLFKGTTPFLPLFCLSS